VPIGDLADCGDYQHCISCYTQEECEGTASSTCIWHSGYGDKFKAIINDDEDWVAGCSWNKNYEEASTSTHPETDIGSRIRSAFGDRIPFAYFYFLGDTFDYLMFQSATGSLSTTTFNPQLIIPTTTYASTSIFDRTEINLFDRTLFFQIAPQSFWNIIKNVLNLLLYVGMGFWIYNQLKKHNIF